MSSGGGHNLGHPLCRYGLHRWRKGERGEGLIFPWLHRLCRRCDAHQVHVENAWKDYTDFRGEIDVITRSER